ncbi:dienelactone hydrolase family protein [Pelagibacterium flavum]|uniref:Dienelactone hydrolase family protein n=1 Tax=Pelagibacterium flavum TaxID=2984530 RepID=A0ABY6IRR4_9HYPH|nr:dienelactone hydrolase family protein [Pelagibacterium sp. YIM 151497]MAN77291.1 dienelactone hydrolase [Hyphomicrobiales bacterium]UYQ71910.1 dienelactone hydrolase family protein [Pelagibacterium sp. YIM 151497]|tara:strand:- start:718 stop:1278 length:561 start_codon:yes stop_codon:yes gene_type:complete
MAHIVLFHSILGLRPVEGEIAAVFEADGHTVTLPDLYNGKSADDYDAGFAIKREISDEEISARATAALESVPDDAVLSGVSFGTMMASRFAAKRPQTAGLLFFAGVAPWFAQPRAGLPVSAHVAKPDPFDDEDYFLDWLKTAGDADIALHRYEGAGHYFLDPSLNDYNEAAAKLCLDRSRAFLKSL